MKPLTKNNEKAPTFFHMKQIVGSISPERFPKQIKTVHPRNAQTHIETTIISLVAYCYCINQTRRGGELCRKPIADITRSQQVCIQEAIIIRR